MQEEPFCREVVEVTTLHRGLGNLRALPTCDFKWDVDATHRRIPPAELSALIGFGFIWLRWL